MTKQTSIATCVLVACASRCLAQPDGIRDDVLEAATSLDTVIEEVALKLWSFSEVSLLEVESSAYLKGLLVERGFDITSEGSGGVPTAFIAEYGEGEPTLGIMLEYDALPNLGNAAVPRREPREDGITSGHGCGHNLIGAAGIGAALAIRDVMQDRSMSGTLRVYGGASEETEGAKVYMAREGLFDDVDAVLHAHPADVAGVINVRTSAQTQMWVEFKGKPAHAGGAPWEGRSALDAVELFLHGLNNMREHIKPTARLHYVIRDGGAAPNIVPEKASVQLTFRGESRSDVNEGVEWIKQIADGAALMTQTEGWAVPYYGMYDLLPNSPLAERLQQHLEQVGLPKFTEEELAFAKELQENTGVAPLGMIDSIAPLPNEPTVGGSSDMGDVSWIAPASGLVIPSLPRGIGLHTWMASAAHGISIGPKAAAMTARVLALTGVDFLTDDVFREAVRADFDRRTEDFEYESPIPFEIEEPISLPDSMRKHGSIQAVREAILKQQGDHGLHHGHDHHMHHDHDHD